MKLNLTIYAFFLVFLTSSAFADDIDDLENAIRLGTATHMAARKQVIDAQASSVFGNPNFGPEQYPAETYLALIKNSTRNNKENYTSRDLSLDGQSFQSLDGYLSITEEARSSKSGVKVKELAPNKFLISETSFIMTQSGQDGCHWIEGKITVTYEMDFAKNEKSLPKIYGSDHLMNLQTALLSPRHAETRGCSVFMGQRPKDGKNWEYSEPAPFDMNAAQAVSAK